MALSWTSDLALSNKDLRFRFQKQTSPRRGTGLHVEKGPQGQVGGLSPRSSVQAQADVYLSPSEPRLPVCKLKGLSRMLAGTAGVSCATVDQHACRQEALSAAGRVSASAAVSVPRGRVAFDLQSHAPDHLWHILEPHGPNFSTLFMPFGLSLPMLPRGWPFLTLVTSSSFPFHGLGYRTDYNYSAFPFFLSKACQHCSMQSFC